MQCKSTYWHISAKSTNMHEGLLSSILHYVTFGVTCLQQQTKVLLSPPPPVLRLGLAIHTHISMAPCHHYAAWHRCSWKSSTSQGTIPLCCESASKCVWYILSLKYYFFPVWNPPGLLIFPTDYHSKSFQQVPWENMTNPAGLCTSPLWLCERCEDRRGREENKFPSL